jgi:hypothetical protein
MADGDFAHFSMIFMVLLRSQEPPPRPRKPRNASPVAFFGHKKQFRQFQTIFALMVLQSYIRRCAFYNADRMWL